MSSPSAQDPQAFLDPHAAYNRWASDYDSDRNLTRDLDRTTTRELLAGRSFARTIEAGCGTGKNTEWLAQISDDVLAMDFSEGMLARARAKITSPRVRFCRADLALPWPCDDDVADLATCNLVLEHIEDLVPVFREAARCLKPGGTLLISEFHPYRQYQGGKARLETAPGETREVEAYVHHVSDFLDAARAAGLRFERLVERRHPDDGDKPPRILAVLWTLPD